MFIWIPVEQSSGVDSKITEMVNAKKWALINFDDGVVKSLDFYDKREDYSEWVDFVIIANKFESFIDLMNEGIMVLCVREEETIDEIMEAFKFKELDEVGL